jgi:hypothetical protein
MTTLSYYINTDCTEDRKQINDNLNIYRSWEAYDEVPKQSLLDWMDKDNVEDFPCYRISLKYPKLYKVVNFICIRPA